MNVVRASAIASLVCIIAACSMFEDEQQAVVKVNLGERGHATSVPPNERPTQALDRAASDESEGSASWSEFISLQAASDQRYLKDIDRRYFGVMSYISHEERAYMLRAGFPTPEEWLAARSMTDGELKSRADAGDIKAAGMLADRMSVELERLVTLDTQHPDAVDDADRALVASTAVIYATRAMQGSRSPFGLYIEGMVKSSIFDTWEPMTAAMLEAMRRGDPRVHRLIEELHARQPEQDIGSIHASLKGMTNDSH